MPVRFVTPTLFMGVPARLSGTVEVTTVEHALAVIRGGGIACLPWGRHDLVAPILEALGASPEVVAQRVNRARTGALV